MVLAVDAIDGAKGYPKAFGMLFLEAISRDPDWDARLNLACCDGMPSEMLLYMVKTGDQEIRKVLAANEIDADSRLMEAHRWLAKTGDSEIRGLLAGNAFLHPTTFDLLLGIEDEEIRVILAGNSGLPHGMTEQFLKDRNPAVRRATVENHEFCDELLSVMASDPDPGVREATREALSRGKDRTPQKADYATYVRKLIRIETEAQSKPLSRRNR